MDRLYRWICNHRALAKTVYTIVLLIDVVYFMPQQSFMLVLLILLALFLTFMVFAAIDNCYVQLLKKPVKLLNEHCDPYPYLEQTELLDKLRWLKSSDRQNRTYYTEGDRDLEARVTREYVLDERGFPAAMKSYSYWDYNEYRRVFYDGQINAYTFTCDKVGNVVAYTVTYGQLIDNNTKTDPPYVTRTVEKVYGDYYFYQE